MQGKMQPHGEYRGLKIGKVRGLPGGQAQVAEKSSPFAP
jgi:hypothetical protein